MKSGNRQSARPARPSSAPKTSRGRRVGGYGIVLIGGCPRSGTTALQVFLGQHPAVATTRETHLFDYYVVPFLRRYANEAEWMKCADGIRHLIPDPDVVGWCRAFAGSVLEAMLRQKPGAKIVLEKTPDNALYGREILRLFPDACFISVIRDPRAVAASFQAASRQPWGKWAPASARDAAQTWLRSVQSIPELKRRFGKRHIVIRYEDFLDPQAGARARLIDFLAAHFPKQAFKLSQFTLPEVGATVDLGLRDDGHNPSKDERNGFFRRGLAEGWRTELAPADARIIRRLCGPMMRRFGY